MVNLGATYALTSQLKLNGTINNVLDKGLSNVSLYQAGRNSTYAGGYFGSSFYTTGNVTPGRNYWLPLNYTF